MNKIQPRLFVLFLYLLLNSTLIFATDYHVSLVGDDSNPGTEESPWRSIEKANRTVTAGDRVIIHQGEYRGQQIAPSSSGEPGRPIVYMAHDSGQVTLTDIKIAILLDGHSYIHVQGITVDGKRLYTASSVDVWVQMHDTHHSEIRDCTFRYAKGWSGVSIDDGSSHNRLLGNRFDYCGIWDDGKGVDRGDIISLKCANHNLLEGNTLRHGGHNLLAVYGRYNVIRDNIFDNSWGTDSNGQPIGNRCLELTNVEGKGCNGQIGGYNVFEGNTVRNGYRASDNDHPQMMKSQGENQIVRRNLIYNGAQEGIGGTANNTTQYARYQHIYHNTIAHNGGPALRLQASLGTDSRENVFKNNISYEVARSPKNNKFSGHIFLNVINSGGDVLNGSEIQGNCFYSNGGNIDWMFIEGVGKEEIARLEGMQGGSISGNVMVSPGFDNNDPRGSGDFSLADGSPLIDRGVALTKVTGSSGSGSSVQVSDARYFSDGFGIVRGDMVRIGDGEPVRIASVDYKAGILKLERSVSWRKGDPVNLDYSGNAPDIGAVEKKNSN